MSYCNTCGAEVPEGRTECHANSGHNSGPIYGSIELFRLDSYRKLVKQVEEMFDARQQLNRCEETIKASIYNIGGIEHKIKLQEEEKPQKPPREVVESGIMKTAAEELCNEPIERTDDPEEATWELDLWAARRKAFELDQRDSPAVNALVFYTLKLIGEVSRHRREKATFKEKE